MTHSESELRAIEVKFASLKADLVTKAIETRPQWEARNSAVKYMPEKAWVVAYEDHGDNVTAIDSLAGAVWIIAGIILLLFLAAFLLQTRTLDEGAANWIKVAVGAIAVSIAARKWLLKTADRNFEKKLKQVAERWRPEEAPPREAPAYRGENVFAFPSAGKVDHQNMFDVPPQA